MTNSDRLTIRISVWAVVVSCIGALLVIGATILAEGEGRGADAEKIKSLEEWKVGADEQFKEFDTRLDRIDGNVQWIRGTLGGGSGD